MQSLAGWDNFTLVTSDNRIILRLIPILNLNGWGCRLEIQRVPSCTETVCYHKYIPAIELGISLAVISSLLSIMSMEFTSSFQSITSIMRFYLWRIIILWIGYGKISQVLMFVRGTIYLIRRYNRAMLTLSHTAGLSASTHISLTAFLKQQREL